MQTIRNPCLMCHSIARRFLATQYCRNGTIIRMAAYGDALIVGHRLPHRAVRDQARHAAADDASRGSRNHGGRKTTVREIEASFGVSVDLYHEHTIGDVEKVST